jgi:hypothetical protein
MLTSGCTQVARAQVCCSREDSAQLIGLHYRAYLSLNTLPCP